MTDRSINSFDASVQEKHHAACSLQIMLKSENNFLENMSKDELKTFKKRFVGTILASDMAKHVADLASFKNRIEINGIKREQNNGNLFLDRTDEASIFDS